MRRLLLAMLLACCIGARALPGMRWLGYFTRDTEINAVLPFRVDNPHPGARPITIRHLVTHTSGILDDDEVYPNSCYLNACSDRRSP